MLKTFLRDDSGATAIEYALVASLIALAVIAGVNGIGTQLNSTFQNITTSLR